MMMERGTCNLPQRRCLRLGDNLALLRKPHVLVLFLQPMQDGKLVHCVMVEHPVDNKCRVTVVALTGLVHQVGKPLGAAEEHGPAQWRTAGIHCLCIESIRKNPPPS